MPTFSIPILSMPAPHRWLGRCQACVQGDAEVQDYLKEEDRHSYDIQLSAELTPAGSSAAQTITQTNFRHL